MNVMIVNKFFLVGPSKHIVQEAIKQLQERGEKVTAFVVIAVAKQVAPLLQIGVGSDTDILLFDILKINFCLECFIVISI